MPGGLTAWIGGSIAILLAIGLLVVVSLYLKLWLQAVVSHAGIGLSSLVVMSLRKVSPKAIVEAKIMAVQAGLATISTNALEAHVLAGGNVRKVIQALIVAHRARLELNWNTAAAIDLAGRNVFDAVQVSVTPKIINCPDRQEGARNFLDGMARDGIQVKVRACVTVRTNLSQLIGGATEDTVIARVGEGIVSAIGSCESYKVLLANPMVIVRQVLEKGLDSQTAFSIVSIDIADIDVGDNVGARLQAERAEADVRVARARAEQRRAMAVALEQEMKALIQENRAQVVLAEAEIPTAQAAAFRTGNLGDRKRRMVLPKDRTTSYPPFAVSQNNSRSRH